MSENPYKVGDKVKILENAYNLGVGIVGEVFDISDHDLSSVRFTDEKGIEKEFPFYLYELEAIPEPEEQPLAEWERELLGLNDELKVGDQVKINESGPYGWRDQTGTIIEKLGEDSPWDFEVEVDNAYPVPFYGYELEKIASAPEPETPTPVYRGRELKVGDKVLIAADEYLSEGFRKGDVVVVKRLGVTDHRGEIGVTAGYAKASLGELTFHDYELELFEYHGVQVGDAVTTTNALNYGRSGTVQKFVNGPHPVEVEFYDGLLTPVAFAPHEVIVHRDIDTSEMNENYLLMLIREAMIEVGKLRNDTREEIKHSTEKSLQTIREYLAHRDAENEAKGYKRGKSDGSREGYRVGREAALAENPQVYSVGAAFCNKNGSRMVYVGGDRWIYTAQRGAWIEINDESAREELADDNLNWEQEI